jgi:hypothetical protein
MPPQIPGVDGLNPSNFTASKTETVTLAPSPPPKGKVFFFEMKSSSSNAVTPRFTLAIYAPDLATAEQWAEAQNGSY